MVYPATVSPVRTVFVRRCLGDVSMISVIVPTLNAATVLPAALAALVPAAVDGVVREVIVADGGSTDATRAIADDAGCRVVAGDTGNRGRQMRSGAALARADWLLFLHADTVLADGWHDCASRFIHAVDAGDRPPGAAAFQFALDDHGFMPRLLEAGVSLRCRLFGLPYGDQGLLISRRLHDDIGGFDDMALMEDVAIVRKLGRRRIVILSARAVTSAERYRRDGYLNRALRNLLCLTMYLLGAPTRLVVRIYG